MNKITFTIIAIIGISVSLKAQTFTSNRTPVGMEHNVLFNANNSSSISVSQTGSAALSLNALFDGKFAPSYTSIAPTESDPTVILIEGLPNKHIQVGAWVGWSTRYWPANRFKIEGYNQYQSANTWNIIADYSGQDYTESQFIQKIPLKGSYTKLRFTFYTATGTNGRLGVSELFFIHPEAVAPYEGLISSSISSNSIWKTNDSDIYYSAGNVGIGTANPVSKLEINGDISLARTHKIKFLETVNGDDRAFIRSTNGQNDEDYNSLIFAVGAGDESVIIKSNGNVGIGTANPDSELSVNGKIHTKEVKVDLIDWSDFVFYDNYTLPTLLEVENHIKEKGHLKDIPSAKEVEKNGIFLGEMNSKLLQKIEELTLYTIQQQKEIILAPNNIGVLF